MNTDADADTKSDEHTESDANTEPVANTEPDDDTESDEDAESDQDTESDDDEQLTQSPPTEYARIADVCSSLVDAVAEVEKLEARQAAWKVEFIDRARTLAVANEEGVSPSVRPKTVEERADLALRSFTAELACTLRISERTASGLIEDSAALMHRLPLTLTALREGEISYRHAQQLVDQTSTLSDEAAAELEERALPFAKTMTVARFRQKTRMLRERLQPESAVQRCVSSVRDRRVEIVPAADGMAWISLFTTAPIAEAIFDTVRAQSMRLRSPSEPRSLAQLDADVLVGGVFESFTGEFSTPDPTGTRVFGTGLGTTRYDTEPATDEDVPVISGSAFGTFAQSDTAAASTDRAGHAEDTERGARRAVYRIRCTGPGADPVQSFRKIVPTVMVTVPVLTLLGKSVVPAILDGYGPIDPETARDLASQAPEFSRLLTHPETGVALSLGHTRYKPSAAMRRFLRYRDGYCRFPGCSRKAVSCDVDHTDPYESGGDTDVNNLASLCPKHHRVKHETDWEVEQLGDGVLKWTSPQGRVYLTHPENPVRGPVPPAKARAGDSEPPVQPMTEAAIEDARCNDVYIRLVERLKRKKLDADADADADAEANAAAHSGPADGGTDAEGSAEEGPRDPNSPPF
ncbi:DUF222 domain-containing protein [Mycetocola zhadangensis]